MCVYTKAVILLGDFNAEISKGDFITEVAGKYPHQRTTIVR